MTQPATMPNFVVIGAAKAGTTSLYHYLIQHPEVFLPPVKEPRFFAYEGETLHYRAADGKEPRINSSSVTRLQDYQEMFASAAAARAIGDISPIYLYSRKAAQNIKRHLPDARIIALLRDPVDRAFSSYVYMVMREMEPCRTFEEALMAEEQRIADNWAPLYHYRQRGFYHAQLAAYYDIFRHEQIGIWLFEDLRDDPLRVCREVFGFLGIDADFTPDLDRDRNASGIPKNRSLNRALESVRGSSGPAAALVRSVLPKQIRSGIRQGIDRVFRNNLERPKLAPETRGQLKEVYRADVIGLQRLIGRELSAWL